MHKLRLYNTMSKKLEFFEPLGDPVGMYTCGPTVYHFAHIGNLRTYLFEDVLKRVLIANGYTVRHIMNITDVGHLTDDGDDGEDKMEASAAKQQMPATLIARAYTEAFLADLRRLNILNPDVMPKATDHIKDQIALIETLEKKGFTYRITDGIYFDTAKLADYGKLARLQEQDLQEGARVAKNPEKRHPADFALWKFSPKDSTRQMEWGSPWGIGFPGWHIECSAMAMHYLGESFDIHCSGIDHIPVHHTNEIAQSEAATGKEYVRYWLHDEFVILPGDARMGKSQGNAITVSDLEKQGYDPLAYRYLTLTTHYRKPLTFSLAALDAAQNALNNLREKVRTFSEPKVGCAEFEEKFMDAVNDDLNMPKALGVMWDLLKSTYPDHAKYQSLLVFDKVLGLGLNTVSSVAIPDEVNTLVAQRETAREQKMYSTADELRDKILALGFAVEDTENGPVVKPN